MKQHIGLMPAILLTLLLQPPFVAAQTEEDRHSFSAVFSGGVEYDSNVAVLDLDSSSGQSDYAAILDVGVGYDGRPAERLSVKAGYDFSQSLHADFDDFDLQIHRGSAGFDYDFGSIDSGLSLQYVNAGLDGSEFLVLRQTSPYVSKLFGTRLFLRLAYAYTDKDFTTSPGRDAVADSLSGDAFVFLNGVRTYLAFGYKHDDEDAIDAQYDYTGHQFKAQLSRRLDWWARDFKVTFRMRYETRDYSAPTPLIGEARQDDRFLFEAMAEMPLGKRMFAEAGYQYGDNRSNLQSVDFGENVVSMKFGARL